MLDRRVAHAPRWLLTCLIVVIYTACALGGRNYLFNIFQNFLALMGYWVGIFLTIALEEQVLFRAARSKRVLSSERKAGGLTTGTTRTYGMAGALSRLDLRR